MDSCIFCKIVSGEIPSATIWENEEFKVILDRFPSNPGHVLILVKKHVPNIYELDPDVGGRLFKLAVQIASIMKKALGFTDMNVLQNNGKMAGQTIDHFHLHLIPRYIDDSVSVSWKPLEPTDEQIEAIRQKIVDML